MVKKKICRMGIYEGYWKGKRVGLVPRYSPHSKPEDYVIEEVEVGEDDSYPRLIDLLKTSVAEIKEICEVNDIPFSWVTGLSWGERGNISIQKTDTLGKVIELFIAMNSAGSTSTQYRRFFDRLIKACIIDLKWTVAEYERGGDISEQAADLTKPEMQEEESRYRSYFILNSFHAFLYDPTYFEVKKITGDYRSKRRKDFLRDEETKVFFPALKEINPIYELVGRILRYYNHEIFENPSEGLIMPIEYLLQLKTYHVGDQNLPSIRGHKLGRSIQFAIYLEDELFERLMVLAKQNDLFVFQNRRGGPINSGQIRRAFKKASKASGLRDISPSHLC